MADLHRNRTPHGWRLTVRSGSACRGAWLELRTWPKLRTLLGVAALLVLGGCGPAPERADPPAAHGPDLRFDTEIRWTSYGIPHVRARDWGSLGYGFAYATARAGVCTIAREIATVNGELSRHFGPGDGNRASDLFHRFVLDAETTRQFLNHQTDHHLNFLTGYVAGYNRWLRDQGNSLPAACRGAPWVRTMTREDAARLTLSVGIRYGLGRFQREIANAAPPGLPVAPLRTDFSMPEGIGSNAIAMGKAITASGRGLLLGNPHYPWRGPSRFHLIHTTIPGELDVMGVSLYTTNRIVIGFNHDVAWTHSVSPALRSTLYALELDPDQPTRYRYGDGYRDMASIEIDLPVRDETGRVRSEHQRVYATHYGPVVVSDQLPWTATRAYAIRDANLMNDRMSATYDALNRARSVAEVENALYMQGVAWASTVAADRHGNAFYADISVTPYVDAELLGRCRFEAAALPPHVVVLNGADPGCAWYEDPRSAVPGAMPPSELPRLRRDDFVVSANDSHWLTNPAAPLEGYSPTLGSERTERSLRTRTAFAFIREALAKEERLEPDDLEDMLDGQRNFAAELLLDDVLRLCSGWGSPVELDGAAIDIRLACEVLSAWDRAATPTSRGAHVWREFWPLASRVDGLYQVPFDPADPVETPRGLAIDDAAVRDGLRTALARAQQKLTAQGLALDAALGDIQFEERNGTRIPIPGDTAASGAWSIVEATLRAGAYTPIDYGNSYLQVVGWNSDGSIDPRGLLTYSQSEDPASPHHTDQTRLYAEGRWIRLPFRDEDIVADPNLEVLRLHE